MNDKIDTILTLVVFVFLFYLVFYLPIELTNCHKMEELIKKKTEYLILKGCYISNNNKLVKLHMNE